MKRLLCVGLAVALAALLALPALAKKDKLPAPDVQWVWVGESFSGGISYYCIELGFHPVKGASPKRGSHYMGHQSPEAYALRVWVKGGQTPELSPADWMINLPPTSEQWTRYVSGQTAASGSLADGKWTFLGYCGYAEGQTLRVRLRALEEKDNLRGKATKTFKIKLPKYGTYRGVKIRAEMGGGHVVYGKVR